MYIKIINLIQMDGKADYKGLDLQKIVPGSQVYPHDRNIAFFEYEGDPVEHDDIEVISELEYAAEVQAFNEYIESLPNPEKEVEELRQELRETQKVVNLFLLGGM